MGLKFTKIPTDTFERLQLNAGILVDSFNPATGVIGNILGATSGGITFASNPSFSDWGEDVDNCPNNMKELKRIEQYDPQVSGEFLTCTPAVVKSLVGAADIGTDTTKIVPRSELVSADFHELWWIGDYSDQNSGATAGFLAIHLFNALNTSGFQIKSEKNAKGKFSFEFHGHYSMEAQDVVPFEIYCKAGTAATNPYVQLDRHSETIRVGDTVTLNAATSPAGATITWSSSANAKASVSDGVVTGAETGSTIITAAITDNGVTYNDTCTIIVVAAT